MALVVGAGATGALASTPKRATNTTAATSTGQSASTRVSEPASFDLAVPDARGGGMTIYRFNRATQTLSPQEHLGAADVSKRAASFVQVSSAGAAIIVLSPEGGKKPPPPPPGGGDPTKWKVPEQEFQAAMKQLKAQVPDVGQISIGQLAPATAAAK